MAEGFVAIRARDIEDASRSRERCSALLARLARARSPGLSPSLLTIFARVASRASTSASSGSAPAP